MVISLQTEETIMRGMKARAADRIRDRNEEKFA